MACGGGEKGKGKRKGNGKVKEKRAGEREGGGKGKKTRKRRGREGGREEEGEGSPLLSPSGPPAEPWRHKEAGAAAGMSPGWLPAPGAAALMRQEAGGLQTPSGCTSCRQGSSLR